MAGSSCTRSLHRSARGAYALRIAVAASRSWSACRVDLGSPAGTEIVCASNKDCPAPLVCSTRQMCAAAGGTPCSTAADCDDGLFCNGPEACGDGFCAPGDAPCMPAFPCVTSTCSEEARGCDVGVDHALCPEGSYCDLGAGCVVGARCTNASDCQDGSVCNGEERCINFHCLGGSAPAVEDGDPCTLDGCDDARAASGLEAIFHVALPTFDGSPCTLAGGGGEVCVSSRGGCVTSACGDGVTFGTEACDSGPLNGDAWSLGPHCQADCGGWAPSCGDNRVDDGFETCDDGSLADTGNGCSDTCHRNDAGCGDRIVQSLFEQCDDGNGDDCDGCSASCERTCVCGTLIGCDGGQWCNESAACQACNTTAHCGPNCAACGYAEWCDVSTGCQACDGATHCGPDCVSCDPAGPAPTCGGDEVGCVADSCAGQPDFTRCKVTAPVRSYDICVRGACVEPGCGTAACNPPGPHFVLPDTDQRLCLSNFDSPACTAFPCNADGSPGFCGQDGQYGWDATHPDHAVRWTRTTEEQPTLTDVVSGLIWQGCPAGLEGSACDLGSRPGYDWDGALKYCEDLRWGGDRDWRLPDRFELQSIVDYGTRQPAIDGTAFPEAWFGGYFWSSSTYAAYPSDAWSVDFQSGYVMALSKSTLYYVRCVRGAPIGVPGRFSRSIGAGDQAMVADNRTGLTWQGCAVGQTTSSCSGTAALATWQQALASCEGLSFGGQTDWRLPNVLELNSLLADDRYGPMLDLTVFPGVLPAGSFWSSTSDVGNSTQAWRVSVSGADCGSVMSSAKASGYFVRCVRGGY